MDAVTSSDRLRSIGVAFLVAVVGFALGLAIMIVLGNLLYAAGYELTATTQLFLSLVALQGLAFPLTAVGYLRYRGLPLSFLEVEWPSLREVGVAVLAWLGLLIALNVLSALVAAANLDPATNQAAETALENPEIIPYLIPLVFLLNAPGEELLFRGVIQESLREHFGPAASVFLATTMFAPAHVVALLGSLQAVLTTITLLFVPGLVFGAVYEYTDNLVVPSLTHGLHNAFIFVGLYVVATTPETETASASVLALVP